MALKSLFFAAKLQKLPSGWGLRSHTPVHNFKNFTISKITKSSETLETQYSDPETYSGSETQYSDPVCDTLELHQIVQHWG